ncbi:HalOD1 output domain-containing protein [Haladaptatus halobius]|uniref:HalOD1 output domain-containing protein n=1 Tax=Haladaptatus halobius TaxID=2884875 RepID=UPI0034A407F8
MSTSIVREIARREGKPAEELASLYEAVDPEALEAIFAPRHNGQPRANGRVIFTYCGYEVTVTSDGTIDLKLLTEGTE